MLLDPAELRPRPAHRDGARRDPGRRARRPAQRRADAVGARDRDAGVPHGGRRDARADDAARLRPRRRARAGPARRLGRARTRSASSSASASRRRTATTRSIDQLQYVARRELIFGMHIHVAVDDPDKAIQIVNGLLPHLAPLLALSASSPFWRGEPTGLAVEPPDRLLGLPPLGAAAALPRLRGLRDGRRTARAHRAASPTTRTSGGTSARTRSGGRSRSASATPSRGVEDAVAIAAYCQALVKQLCERYDAGEEIPIYHRILTSENKWLAARYGLEAPVMDLATGQPDPHPDRASSSGARCASSSRTRASSARSASSRGSRRSSAAATGRAPAAHLQREPRHRRGRARDRGSRPSRRTRARPPADGLRPDRERPCVDPGEHGAAPPREPQHAVRGRRPSRPPLRARAGSTQAGIARDLARLAVVARRGRALGVERAAALRLDGERDPRIRFGCCGSTSPGALPDRGRYGRASWLSQRTSDSTP